MINFKKIIAQSISEAININSEEIEQYIEIPKELSNGDYSFPCFRLAKELRNSPQNIATQIKEKIKIDEKYINKMDVIGGYLNFYVDNKEIIKDTLNEISKDDFGKYSVGNGKIL